MRVLMTGGYGCIGSWVAKRLVEQGQEVWIFNLKEDTHRLDLLLEPERAVAPRASELVSHGDHQLPIAPDLDDSRLEARLGPIPRTSPRDGIAETHLRFAELHAQGRLDLSDLG